MRVALGLLLLLGILSVAQAEPTKFKTLELGATWEDVYAANPFLTCIPPYADGKRECAVFNNGARNYPLDALTTIGELRIELLLTFFERRLARVFFNFPTAQFEGIRSAIEGKYGPPSSAVVDQLTNGVVKIESRRVGWILSDAVIILSEQPSRIGQGHVMYAHRGLGEKMIQLQKPKPSDF